MWSLSSKTHPARLPGRAGMEVRTSDIHKGHLHDITSPEGFLLSLKNVLRIRRNGLLWLGVPCNSNLGLSTHSTLY